MWEQIERELPYLRQCAEEAMRDALHAERPTGKTIRVDGKTVPELVTVWSGRGKIQSTQAYPSQPEAGGGTATLAVFEVHVPVGEPFDFLVDDEFVVDVSRDPNGAGRRFRYRTDPVKTWRTARRFNCEEVVS